jgi:hypothetical protein
MAERYSSATGRYAPPPVRNARNNPPAGATENGSYRSAAGSYTPPPVGRPDNFGHTERIEAEVLKELGDQERGGPVSLTYFPTRTSNPGDPRTAAAGYDSATQTMRVEWGDGGAAYNYYGVPPNIWRNFRRAPSPGKYINRVLNSYTYGPA